MKFYKVERTQQLDEPLPQDSELQTPTQSRSFDAHIDMEFLTEGHPCASRINATIIEQCLQQPDTLAPDQAVDNYMKDIIAEFHSDIVIPFYYKHLQGRAQEGRNRILNYRCHENTHAGGAHPGKLTTIMRFNSDDGTLITLDDVFPLKGQAELQQKLLTKLMQRHGVTTLAQLQELGFLSMSDFFVSSNFALRPDSIEFFYNEYDIAPYAYGTTTLCLDYDEARELINPALKELF